MHSAPNAEQASCLGVLPGRRVEALPGPYDALVHNRAAAKETLILLCGILIP